MFNRRGLQYTLSTILFIMGRTYGSGHGSNNGNNGSNGRTTGSYDPNSYSGKNAFIDLLLSKNGDNYFGWLKSLGELSNNPNFSIIDLLSALGSPQIGSLDHSESNDYNFYLFKQLLSVLLTQENRQYNENLLNNQRIYDSPLNQLARLMGAGVSRDAAIQMMSGSGGSGSSGMPFSQPAGLADQIAPSQSHLNGVQADTAIANSVFQGIQAIGSLVGVGFSIPQAIGQITQLGIQNTMSQKALQGLQSADAVMSGLENAVSTGVLTTKDVDGFSNATDALNYINDHKDTNVFKPLFDSGAFQNVYGTKLGREMFTQNWENVRKSKDSGTLLDQHIKQQIAASELSQLDIKKGYTDLQYAIGELSRQDVEIQKIWNDVWEGNVRIEIAGEELKLKKNEVAITNNSVVRSNNEQAIYDAVMSGEESDGTIDLRNLQGSGNKLLAMSTWCDLYDAFNKAYVMAGNEKQRFNWEVFYQNNADAAKFMSGIQLTAAQIQSNAINPDLNPLLSSIMSLYLIGRSTGAFDMLKIGSDVVKPSLPYIFTPNKAQ